MDTNFSKFRSPLWLSSHRLMFARARRVGALTMCERARALVSMASPVHVPALSTAPKTADGARELYDQWAEGYDEALLSWDYPAPSRCAEILKQAGAAGTARILDIGCGTGMSGEALRAMGLGASGGGIVGLDISSVSCELARAKGCYESAHVANLNELLPVEDCGFDAAVCVGVLSYIERFDVLAPEICRVLKLGAPCVLTHRIELWDSDDRGCRTAFEALVAAGHMELTVGGPEAYMPRNPDPSEQAKRIRIITARRVS